MKDQILKHKGKTVWKFKYKFIDDYRYNQGYKALMDTFVGTSKDFIEFCEYEAKHNGTEIWDVKKKHASKQEYENLYLLWN